MRLMLCSVILLLSTSLAAETWRVVGNATFVPYSYIDPVTNTPKGLDVDLVSAVLKDAGVDFQIRLYPWQRVIKMLANGQADMAFIFTGTLERQLQFHLVGPIREGTTRFMTRLGFPLNDWHDLNDLEPYVIGQVAGYTYESTFDSASLKRDKTALQAGQLVAMLLAERVNIIVGDALQLLYLAREQDGVTNVRMLPTPLVRMPRYVAFTKGQSVRAEQFNEALQRLRANGTLDAIIANWRQEVGHPLTN